MLSVNLLDRSFRCGRHERLLEALSANGLDLPLALRVRLAATPVPAMALGLRRLVELTYGPTVLSREMLDALLAAQRPDGAFGGEGCPAQGDPLATACAVAALEAVLAGQAAVEPRLRLACDSALEALAHMQLAGADDVGFHYPADRSGEDRALAAAFILSLLAESSGFRAAVRFADLMNWFEAHEYHLGQDVARLLALARQELPDPGARSPALAAIAA